MIPTTNEILTLHKKYASSDKHFDRIYTHCQIVARIAEYCIKTKKLQLDTNKVITASLLHDIAAYMLMDESGNIHPNYYQLHASFGAKILLDEGVDEDICKMIETHMLPTIPQAVLDSINIPFPNKDYSQKTIEAELVCYADRFHSKEPRFNSVATLERNMKEFSDKLALFKTWQIKFSIPDIESLSLEYGHPIK